MTRLFLAAAALLFALAPRAALAAGCGKEPDPAALDGSAEDITARARAAFAAKRYLEAAPLFRAVAMKYAAEDAGRAAVGLALESLKLGAKEGGAGCYDAMAEDVPKYLALYCATPDAPCGPLRTIARDIERLRVEKIVQEGDKGGRGSRERYVEAGKQFVALWIGYAQEACRARQVACERSDEMLYAASRAFRAGGEPSKAFAARAMLIDPANNLANGELAKKALLDQGRDFQAIGEYARAADYLERFMTVAPKDDKAIDALLDAIVLRIALGAMDSVERDVGWMEKNYGTKSPQRVAAAELAFAGALADAERWADAEKLLRSRASSFAKVGGLEEVRWSAALGHALAAQGKGDAADAAYQHVAAAPMRELARQFAPHLGDVDAERALGRALLAVGEAKLHLADRERDAAMKLAVKKGDAASLQAKRAAVEKAERAYVEILALEPAPPPTFVVAAAGRVARMRSQLWGQAYLALGPQAAEIEERDAVGAAMKCVELGAKFQAQDAGSRACAAWLSRHLPARFPPLREILPVPHGLGEGFVRTPPLDQNGEPWRSPE